MNKFLTVLFLCAIASTASASWYWPFGGSGEDVSKARISELMAPVSELIDSASDYAESGKVNEAVEEYRKALAALDRIEYENPDRIGTPEFSTVNNKRAYVDAAIDSLLLKQAQQNAKAVAVTDTTELERKYARLKGKYVPEDSPKTNAVVDAVVTERPVTNAVVAAASPKAEAKGSPEREQIKTLLSVNPRDRRARLRLAMVDLRDWDFDAARLTVAELLTERPNDAAALNLRAAIESETGDYKAAERTLDQAIRSNPRGYNAYYNMAKLFITTRGASGKAAARRYYETGRSFGGPVNAELEGLLK